MIASQIVKKAAGPAIATDQRNRIIGWNRAARELFEYNNGFSVLGKGLNELLEARDIFGNRLDFAQIPFHQMATRGEQIHGFEIDAKKKCGGLIRIMVSVVVVLGAKRGQYSLVYMLRPILRRRKADEVIERVLANPAHGRHILDRTNGNGNGNGNGDVPMLTRRQSEVLKLLSQGHNNEEIANALFLSVFTVRSHVQSILDKLEVHSKVEAVSKAFRDRLI